MLKKFVQQGRSELPLIRGGWDDPYCARPTRAFGGRALREHGDRPIHPAHFSASCYRMVGSKLTLAFMELEIRQFASAFSISSLALVASPFAGSVMVGFNVMAVN